MKRALKLFVVAFFSVLIFCSTGCNGEKVEKTGITETSNLYGFEGGIVKSKMQSKQAEGTEYSFNIKYGGEVVYVPVTKSEYNSFDINDTIKVIKKQEPSKKEEPVEKKLKDIDGPGYKIVLIDGNYYLVIKLENGLFLNDSL
jgi:uncharacterized lipoprotein YehR (DUF1307 family)